jgi:probable HAF family extracellular repeat protein
MKSRKGLSFWQWGLALLLVLALGGPAVAAPQYQFHDLGTLGGTVSVGMAVNSSGLVAGQSYTSTGAYHAFIYQYPGGPMQDLGTLGGFSSGANAINDSGQVVGGTEVGDGYWHPFLYPPGGPMQALSTLGSWESAFGINASGQVVGWTAHAFDSATMRAIIYPYLNGPMQYLGDLENHESTAAAINASGQVVGMARTAADNYQYAYLYPYPGGPIHDLGTLGGNESVATGINDSGQVVGSAQNAAGAWHAFLYPPGGPMQDLGTLGGTTWANSINATGQVVGYAFTATGQMHAFLYADGHMQDLNDLVDLPAGVFLEQAFGINDQGWIVGQTNGPAFLLTPAEIKVSIDIKPGGSDNSINPKSQGKIPVAILSTPDFYAPDKVDLTSLTFGRTGNEHSLDFCTIEDVNRDGVADVVGHFDTQTTGFQKGDTKGYLKGKTKDGIAFSGSDSVRIVPGK